MTLKNKTLLSVAALLTSVMASTASAVSIDWKGTYRFEWTQVDRPSLATPYGMKSYGLNYLSLSPKIIATDGVSIVSKFDVLANQDAAYQNAQFGQLWGQGWPTAAAPTYQRNTTAQNQKYTQLLVSQLYLNLNQEYGALVAGRAPIEFGMGITHNAGNGLFDHWGDTMDVVGYKFIIDNFFIMPMVGRVYDEDVAQGNTVQDTIIHLQYESKESGSLIGVMQQNRKASLGANDAPYTGTVVGNYNVQTISFVLGREWEKFAFKMEAGFNSGSTGKQSGAGEDVKANGYGIATEFNFPRKDSKFEWSLRVGMATGDDPNSSGTYEGFQFDRNYDVAFLMFNHRLGQEDFLSTDMIKDTTKTVATSLDDEAISNAIYISPKFTYVWGDRLDLNNTLTYAQLMTNPIAGNSGFQKDLGFEWDIDLVYKPTDRIQWINQLGLLFPGAAFKNGNGAGGNLDNAFTYGFATKAAISF
ncbi:alginate export family protein [Bdellovibrio sp. HCB337]|uniref:alginate export family protein n=1 Tax=Bdellovibrio sp. HCB337 TaxID=3394358 RepID=UPI0039A48C17